MKNNNVNCLFQTRGWWAVLLVGLLLIIGGFAYWFWPQAGYAVASQIFGWLLIATGVVQLCVSSSQRRPHGWGWWLAGGVIDVFIGFMLVRSVILSEMVLPYFLAFIFIFWGVEAFANAARRRRPKYRWLEVVNGVLLCLIGYFFLEAGFLGNLYMVSFLTAIAFIYWGFTLAIASTEMRPVESE